MLEGEKKKEKPLHCGENQCAFGPRGVNQTVSRIRGGECSILELGGFLNSVTCLGGNIDFSLLENSINFII